MTVYLLFVEAGRTFVRSVHSTRALAIQVVEECMLRDKEWLRTGAYYWEKPGHAMYIEEFRVDS